MDRYVQQLIEDMKLAALKVPAPGDLWAPVDMNNAAEVDDIAFAERYLHGTPQPLEEIVGVAHIALPPAEKLNRQQALQLSNALIQLLEAFHFYPDFPEGLPTTLKYQLLRDEWIKPHVFVGAGESHIEFCYDYLGNCPFPEEFCECMKLERETEHE